VRSQLVKYVGLEETSSLLFGDGLAQASRQRPNRSGVEEVELRMPDLLHLHAGTPGGEPGADQRVDEDLEVALHSMTSVGIEVKATRRWRREDGAALVELHQAGRLRSAVGVCLGREPLRVGTLEVEPLEGFLASLRRGDVIG
jgi:hypothetical protein